MPCQLKKRNRTHDSWLGINMSICINVKLPSLLILWQLYMYIYPWIFVYTQLLAQLYQMYSLCKLRFRSIQEMRLSCGNGLESDTEAMYNVIMLCLLQVGHTHTHPDHKLFTLSSFVATFLVHICLPLSIFYCIHWGKSFLICIIPYDLIGNGTHLGQWTLSE